MPPQCLVLTSHQRGRGAKEPERLLPASARRENVPFLLCCVTCKDRLEQRSPTFLAPGTGFVEDNFFPGPGGGDDGSGGDGSDGERWGAAGEAFLVRPPPTSCCAAWFLTGCGPLPARGLGTPDSEGGPPYCKYIPKGSFVLKAIKQWSWFCIGNCVMISFVLIGLLCLR